MKWIFVVESPTEIRDLKILTPIWNRWNRRELFQMWKKIRLYKSNALKHVISISSTVFPYLENLKVHAKFEKSDNASAPRIPVEKICICALYTGSFKKKTPKNQDFCLFEKKPVQKVKTFTKIRFTCASWF